MTDPRQQTDAQLAAIAERAEIARNIVWLKEATGYDTLMACQDRVTLLAHIKYINEELAEAKRDIDRLIKKLECPANARDE